jgi:hypothetical protein
MFFLGGFNSIIPYLLYLSLIWVFMIIGFHGKIIEAWNIMHPKEYHADNVIIHQPVGNTLLITQKAADQHYVNTGGIVNAIDYYPHAVLCIGKVIPFNITTNVSLYLSSLTFRGPPAIFA